jgi:hypothetical protein
MIALMMETIHTSKTPVNFYETIRRNISGGCHLHIHRCESLKSYNVLLDQGHRTSHGALIDTHGTLV